MWVSSHFFLAAAMVDRSLRCGDGLSTHRSIVSPIAQKLSFLNHVTQTEEANQTWTTMTASTLARTKKSTVGEPCGTVERLIKKDLGCSLWVATGSTPCDRFLNLDFVFVFRKKKIARFRQA
jgi:hypothetical protein